MVVVMEVVGGECDYDVGGCAFEGGDAGVVLVVVAVIVLVVVEVVVVVAS